MMSLSDEWMNNYKTLAFYSKHMSSINYLHNIDTKEALLISDWVCSQRYLYSQNMLEAEHIRSLNAVRVCWHMGWHNQRGDRPQFVSYRDYLENNLDNKCRLYFDRQMKLPFTARNWRPVIRVAGS